MIKALILVRTMCADTQLQRLIRNDFLWELWKIRDLSVKYLADRTFDGSINGNGLEFKDRDEFEKVGCKTS